MPLLPLLLLSLTPAADAGEAEAAAQAAIDAAKEVEQAAAVELAIARLTGPLEPLGPQIRARLAEENNLFALTVDARDADTWLAALHADRGWKKLARAAKKAPVTGDDGLVALLDGVCSDAAIRIDIRWGFCAAVWRSLTEGGVRDWRTLSILSQTAGAYGDPKPAYYGAAMAFELNPGDADAAWQTVTYALYASQLQDAVNATAVAMQLRMDGAMVRKVATRLAGQDELPVAQRLLTEALKLSPADTELLAAAATLGVSAP